MKTVAFDTLVINAPINDTLIQDILLILVQYIPDTISGLIISFMAPHQNLQ